MILDTNKLFVHLGSFVPPEPKRIYGDPCFTNPYYSLYQNLNNLYDWYKALYPPLRNILAPEDIK